MSRPLENKRHRQWLRQWLRSLAGNTLLYHPPDLENASQLLQYLRITAEATSNSVFSLCIKSKGAVPYWVVAQIDTTYIQSFRPSSMIRLIEHRIVHLIGMSSNEFLTQHALGTLESKFINISVEPNPRTWLDLQPDFPDGEPDEDEPKLPNTETG